MATPAEIAELRNLINEPTATEQYPNSVLGVIIDTTANVNAAAEIVWTQKAARYAELVNVKEGSSSRDLGDLYEQALSMSKHFRELATLATGGTRRSHIRPVERA